MIKEYIVTKKILNVRNKPSDENDDTFIGQLLQGTTVWLDETEIIGTIPKGGTSNVWLSSNRNNLVAKDGVVEASIFWIKEFGIDTVWQKTKGDGVTIIVIDSGVKDCDDLKNKKITKKTALNDNDPVDSVGHGTLMTSIIAGSGENIYGVSPNADIISIKFTNSHTGLNVQDFIAACNLLPNFVKTDGYYVVNFSLDFAEDISGDEKSAIQTAINQVSRDNVIFVAAVGNEAAGKTIPASLANVISCSGFIKINDQFVRLGLANYWKEIIITAPGEFPADNLSPLFNAPVKKQGTSHACAFISGLSALILSSARNKKKSIGFNELVTFFTNSSDVVIEDDKTFNILNKAKLLACFNNI